MSLFFSRRNSQTIDPAMKVFLDSEFLWLQKLIRNNTKWTTLIYDHPRVRAGPGSTLAAKTGPYEAGQRSLDTIREQASAPPPVDE